MNSGAPFTPGLGANYNQQVSATTSSATATLSAGMSSLRIANGGTAPIAFRTGLAAAGTLTAVFATDTVVLPGDTRIFTIPDTYDTVAVITGTGTATVYLSRGQGNN